MLHVLVLEKRQRLDAMRRTCESRSVLSASRGEALRRACEARSDVPVPSPRRIRVAGEDRQYVKGFGAVEQCRTGERGVIEMWRDQQQPSVR